MTANQLRSLAGAAGLALLSIGAVMQQPDEVVYYDVNGASVQEVRNSLDLYGPVGNDGRHHDGQTRYSTPWKFTSSRTPTGCKVSTSEVGLKVVITMPRWSGANLASGSVGLQWRTYLKALMLHELGHKKIRMEAADSLRAIIARSPEQPACDAVSRMITDSVNVVVGLYNARNQKHDKDTDHGRSQGARFP